MKKIKFTISKKKNIPLQLQGTSGGLCSPFLPFNSMIRKEDGQVK